MSAPAVATPVFVSQLTSLAVLGIPERRFREWAARLPHRRLGQLVIVDVEVARAALRAEQSAPADDELEQVRRRAGLQLVGGATR